MKIKINMKHFFEAIVLENNKKVKYYIQATSFRGVEERLTNSIKPGFKSLKMNSDIISITKLTNKTNLI